MGVVWAISGKAAWGRHREKIQSVWAPTSGGPGEGRREGGARWEDGGGLLSSPRVSAADLWTFSESYPFFPSLLSGPVCPDPSIPSGLLPRIVLQGCK